MTKSILKIWPVAVCAMLLSCGGVGNTTVNSNSAGKAEGNRPTANKTSAAVNTANTPANNATTTTTDVFMTDTPEAFLRNAAEGGNEEVELGRAAATKAQNAEVKKFGQMMAADHAKANAELVALAKRKNVPLPTDAGSKKEDVDRLKGLAGAEFDREYVDMMVDDHEADITAFERQASNGTDPEVKAFAAKTLPVLKKHLEVIKALQAKMNE